MHPHPRPKTQPGAHLAAGSQHLAAARGRHAGTEAAHAGALAARWQNDRNMRFTRRGMGAAGGLRRGTRHAGSSQVHARSSPMPSQRMPGRSAALVLSPAGAAQRHAQALLVVALHQQAAAAALRQPLRRAQHHACAREQRGGAGGGSAADACGAGRASRPAPGSLRSCPAAALAAGQAQTAAKAIRRGLRQPPMTPPVALTREGCAEALQARHGGQEGALELLRPAAGGAQGLHTHSAGHRDAAGAEARRRRHEAA